MKWYQENFVNRRDWILDNLADLKMSYEEIVVVLFIDFFNSNNINITLELLAAKTNSSKEDINKIISILCAKNYLDIKAVDKHIVFDLSKLFESEYGKEKEVLKNDLNQIFETEFQRPLSNDEFTKLNQWLKIYDKKKIIMSLRKASMYQKLNFAYIEKILENS